MKELGGKTFFSTFSSTQFSGVCDSSNFRNMRKSKHMISEVLKSWFNLVSRITWRPLQNLSYVFTGPFGVHHILCTFAHANLVSY
jgi:hypothetical protein